MCEKFKPFWRNRYSQVGGGKINIQVNDLQLHRSPDRCTTPECGAGPNSSRGYLIIETFNKKRYEKFYS